MGPSQNLQQLKNQISNNTKRSMPIGVIGTGNYATALTKRLTSIGYQVIMGSRNPSKRESALILAGKCMCGVEVTSIERCIESCDIIFVAIYMEDFKVTLGRYSHLVRNKVVVDISNREYRYAKLSNAQHLANILPNSSVVKAFNTVSASSLEELETNVSNPKVYVASDDKVAKNIVIDLVKKMGFLVVDFGNLESAFYLEDFVLRVFTRWKIPIFLAFGIFNLWCLYIIYIYFIDKTAYKWDQIFLKVFNKPLCMTAITLVALTYMPAQIAAIFQVCHGTKHRRFPRFLDGWLKSRKQLGLISFLLVVFHVIASTLMMSPTYYRSWYHQPEVTIPSNLNLTSKMTLPVSTAWMVWKGEAALLFGISAFLVMSILAVTSIPSVADTLNWSEWRCVHSRMGTCFMLFSVAHVITMGAPGWVKGGYYKTVQSITFLSIILPGFVLLSKLIFFLPPLRGYLKKIRRGWERQERSTPRSATKSSFTSKDVLNIHCFDDVTVEIDNRTLVSVEDEKEVLVGDPFLSGKSGKGCRCTSDDCNHGPKRTSSSTSPSSKGIPSIKNIQCECSSV